ncbi:hypothetical protein [Bradyrhizobium retamae]|uniref:hypothetical protein n=1 Tax=Bradyrhizobium retamae TaxID=1300035 RepID=UPI000A713ED7|nr:hypothetical protein [Bradyrhizobium retamae]
MSVEISDFELAMFIAWLAASLASCLGMAVVFEVKQRRSPVGRIAPHRWFGV